MKMGGREKRLRQNPHFTNSSLWRGSKAELVGRPLLRSWLALEWEPDLLSRLPCLPGAHLTHG